LRNPPALKPLPSQNSAEVFPLARHRSTRVAHLAKLVMHGNVH
jgi:hypothetical protein